MRNERFARFAGIELVNKRNFTEKVLLVMSYDFVDNDTINIIVIEDGSFPNAFLAHRDTTVQEVMDSLRLGSDYNITKTYNTFNSIKITL